MKKSPALVLFVAMLCFSNIAMSQVNKSVMPPQRDHKLSFCGHTNELIKQRTLVDCARLQIDDGRDSTLRVVGYKIYVVPNTEAIDDKIEEYVVGPGFTDQLRDKIANLKSGAIVAITEVECFQSGQIFMLKDMTFKMEM